MPTINCHQGIATIRPVCLSRRPIIIHVIVGLNVGGAELMLFRLIKDANSKTNIFEHQVVSLTSLGEIGPKLMAMGIPVYTLELRGLFNIFTIFLKLVHLFRQINPSIVQTWMYHSDLIGGLAARVAGISNVVWNIRNTLIPQGRWSRSQLIIRLCAWLSKWIPRRIVCCAEAGRFNHIQMGYAIEKMIVIPNGYDLDLYSKAFDLRHDVRNKFGFSANCIVIGIVGRFDELKDYGNFISAAKIVSKHKSQVRFLMIGRGIQSTNLRLMSLLENTGYIERFILLGERDDTANLMAAMDIYCLSSRAEGFPNVVAEAMAVHLPCVVTDVGDAALIVHDSGQVVPSQNSNALADALICMTNLSSDQRRDLGNRARELIEQRYSIGAIVDMYTSLYLSFDLELPKND
jgi:glycosyltransferase involved in cell wall biosynthesis